MVDWSYKTMASVELLIDQSFLIIILWWCFHFVGQETEAEKDVAMSSWPDGY